jgi:hypothetical protein
MAEKSVVNEVALMSGTEAELEPPPGVLAPEGEPPEELLPQADAASPSPSSAAAKARLLCSGKVILLEPGLVG